MKNKNIFGFPNLITNYWLLITNFPESRLVFMAEATATQTSTPKTFRFTDKEFEWVITTADKLAWLETQLKQEWSKTELWWLHKKESTESKDNKFTDATWITQLDIDEAEKRLKKWAKDAWIEESAITAGILKPIQEAATYAIYSENLVKLIWELAKKLSETKKGKEWDWKSAEKKPEPTLIDKIFGDWSIIENNLMTTLWFTKLEIKTNEKTIVSLTNELLKPWIESRFWKTRVDLEKNKFNEFVEYVKINSWNNWHKINNIETLFASFNVEPWQSKDAENERKLDEQLNKWIAWFVGWLIWKENLKDLLKMSGFIWDILRSICWIGWNLSFDNAKKALWDYAPELWKDQPKIFEALKTSTPPPPNEKIAWAEALLEELKPAAWSTDWEKEKDHNAVKWVFDQLAKYNLVINNFASNKKIDTKKWKRSISFNVETQSPADATYIKEKEFPSIDFASWEEDTWWLLDAIKNWKMTEKISGQFNSLMARLKLEWSVTIASVKWKDIKITILRAEDLADAIEVWTISKVWEGKTWTNLTPEIMTRISALSTEKRKEFMNILGKLPDKTPPATKYTPQELVTELEKIK